MEDLGTAKGSIELDFSKLSSGISTAVTQLEKIESTSKGTDTAMKSLQTSMTQSAQKTLELSNKLNSANSKVQVYEKEIGVLKTQLEAGSTAQKTLATTIASTTSKYAEAKTTMQQLATKYGEAKQKVTALTTAQKTNATAIKDAKNNVKTTAQAYESAKKSLENMTMAERKNSDNVKAAQANIDKLGKEYEDAKKSLADLTTAQEKNNTAIKEAKDNVKTIGDEYKEAKSATKQYATELNDLEKDQKQLDSEMADATKKLNEFEDGCASAKSDVNRLTTELQTSESTTKTFAQNFEEAGKKLETVGANMQKVGDKVSKVGDKLTKSVSVPLAGAATASLAVSGNFESAMSQVQATMGITKDATTELNGATVNTMDTLKDLAKQLGASTAWSAKDCADALNYLALAGYSTEEIVGTLPTVLNLASAGGYDLATASDQVTDAMSALGLGVSDAKMMVDQMAKTSSTTNTSVSQLGEGILTIGATAKGMKGGVTELNAALGILANNGLKGSEGGTHLRNILLSLQSPTDEAAKTLETLGVKMYDAEGNMRSLNDVFGDLKSSISGMTQEGQDSVISTLFNTRDLASASTLMASAGDQWTTLQNTIANSEGAASQMAETQLDNMKGQITILKSAVEGLGISFGELMLPDAKKAIAWAQSLIDSINNLDDGTKKLIIRIGAAAIATGPILKIGGKVITGMGKITKGTGTIITSIANVVKKTGTLTTATDSVTASAGTAVSSLGKFGPAALGITAASAAIVALSVSFDNAYKKAVKNNLANHFGDIELSAEEAAEAAKKICDTPWSATLTLYSNANEELKTMNEGISSTIEKLNETEWKIKTGFELSEDEMATYKSDIESYMSQTQEYVSQKKLTTSLAIDTLFGSDSAEGSNMQAFINDFYSGTTSDLTKLGDELSNLINEAFINGTLDDAATQESIRNAKAAIQKEMDAISQAEYDVKMGNIVASVPKDGLNAESFANVQKEMGALLQDQYDSINDSTETIMVDYRLALNKGEISQEEYDEAVKNTLQAANDKIGTVELQSVNYSIETISNNYDNASKDAINNYAKGVTDMMNQGLADCAEKNISFNKLGSIVNKKYFEGMSNFTEEDKTAINGLLDNMTPDRARLEQILIQCEKDGKAVPEAVTEGLSNIYSLEAMTGSMNSLHKLMAMQIASSPEAQQSLVEARGQGQAIPAEISDALKAMYPTVYDATLGIFDTLSTGSAMSAENIKTAFSQMGYDFPDAFCVALASKDIDLQNQTMATLQSVRIGADVSATDLSTAFTALGVDLPNGLITSLDSKSEDVKNQAISLLMQLPGATDEKRADVLQSLSDMGVESADTYVDSVRTTVDNAGDITVDVSTGDGKEHANSWLTSFSGWLKDHSASALAGVIAPITIPFTAGKNVLSALGSLIPHATGGIIDSPEISLMGEDGAEAIIPLTAKYRSEALDLYSTTGQMLGVDGVTSNSNDELVNRIVDALKSTQITPNVNVNMTDGDVLLNGEKVGRKLAPTISRLQAQK